VKRPYYLKKRGAFWYYRLNPESGLIAGENLNYYTILKITVISSIYKQCLRIIMAMHLTTIERGIFP